MNKYTPPSKAGQICNVIHQLPDEIAAEAYILTEDVYMYTDTTIIYVVSISDIQRNISNPSLAARIPFRKSELTVIAEDLISYVESWNN